MNKDLTTGRPETVLWKFCLPLIGSILFQQLYNIADSLVAGKFIGEDALAAVGNSYEITLIFIAFAFGCNIGCSVLVSQLFGAKNYRDMKISVSTAMISTAAVCLILMLTGILGSRALLELIRTPDNILADSGLYLNIYVWGLPFLFFYNLATGIFSALGDSRTPFLFLSASSTANILVDILFVSAFHMGIAGVAWATFLCQGISCVLAVITVFRRLADIPSEKELPLFSWPLFRRFAVIAIPSTIQQCFISVGNIVIQGVINGFGSGVIAGYSAAIKLNNLAITAFSTLSNGMSNYTAQNLGAGILPRIRAGFRAGCRLAFLLCIPIVLLYMAAGNVLVGFFIDNPSETALLTGIRFLQIVAPFYFIVSAKLVADGILRGAGMIRNFMISTFTDLLLRVVLAMLFASMFGSVGIWCAWPFGWTISTGISLFFYRRGPWSRNNQPQERNAE